MDNLYGWSLSKLIPTRDFHEVGITTRIQRNSIKAIIKTSDNEKCGYLIERDVEYLFKIHEKNKTFCILTRKKTIEIENFITLNDEN